MHQKALKTPFGALFFQFWGGVEPFPRPPQWEGNTSLTAHTFGALTFST